MSSSGASAASPSAHDNRTSANAGFRASTGPCRYVPTTRPCRRAFAPVAVADAGGDTAERRRALAERGDPAVVLEPGERRERRGLSQTLQPDGLGHHLAHRPRPCALHRLDVEEPDALVCLAARTGERTPHHLEACAHSQHHGTPRDPPRQRAVVDQRACRTHLGPVLPAAEAVDVGLGHRRVRNRLQQLHVTPSPRRASGKDQPVAAVAVCAEEVGEQHRHPQRSRAHAGVPSRSWKAV